MDSYQSKQSKKFVKKPMYLRKKEFIDEGSFERDGSIEKIGCSSPNIKMNYSTIKNENIDGNIVIAKDKMNWRSIENS